MQKEPVKGGEQNDISAAATTISSKPEGERPTNGSWDVVIASPGVQWFADLFCKALCV